MKRKKVYLDKEFRQKQIQDIINSIHNSSKRIEELNKEKEEKKENG